MNEFTRFAYQLPSGTSGGTVVAGCQKLPFNTILDNGISKFCLHADSRFELPQGEYIIELIESVNKTGEFQIMLHNYDKKKKVGVLVKGNSTSLGDIKHNHSLNFKVLENKVNMGIVIFSEFNRYEDGLGVPKNEDSFESYNEIKIWKVA